MKLYVHFIVGMSKCTSVNFISSLFSVKDRDCLCSSYLRNTSDINSMTNIIKTKINLICLKLILLFKTKRKNITNSMYRELVITCVFWFWEYSNNKIVIGEEEIHSWFSVENKNGAVWRSLITLLINSKLSNKMTNGTLELMIIRSQLRAWSRYFIRFRP